MLGIVHLYLHITSTIKFVIFNMCYVGRITFRVADFFSLPCLNEKHDLGWSWGGINYSCKSVRKT